MVKHISFFIILFILISTFTGCTTAKTDYSGLSTEDAEIRSISDPILMEYLGIHDVSSFDVQICDYRFGIKEIQYTFILHGYNTYQTFYVRIHKESGYQTVTGSFGNYKEYLKKASALAIKSAEIRLQLRLLQYASYKPVISMWIHPDGYLCLGAEIILDAESPENHKHIFIIEKVCDKDE